MKQYLKILSLFVLSLFISCEKDEMSNDGHEHLQVDKSVITFKEFKNKTQIKNFNVKIDKNTHSSQSISARNSSDFTTFIIDTTLVKQRIQSNGNYTFTLPVIPIPHQNTENLFYNIVFYKAETNWQWSVLEYEKNTNESYNVKEIVNDFNNNGLVNMRTRGVWTTTITKNCVGCTGDCDLCHLCVSTTTTYGLGNSDDPTSQFEVIIDYDVESGSTYLYGYLNPFINRLTPQQLNVYNENPSIAQYLLHHLVVVPIPNYNPMIGGNGTQTIIEPEAEEIANIFIQNAIESGLNLDFEISQKSPANIDISLVQGTSEAEKKFRCIYEKLTQSPSFKNLFIDTFGVNNRINVKFEVVENLTLSNPNGSISYPNGTCQMSWINNNYNNTIKISTNILEGQRSNIEIAKTILHECIHAYLNIKKINCNNGTTIPQINNKLFPELLSSFYQDNCFIDVNGVNQGEHSFMFDYMIPVFQQILGEVRDLMIPLNHIQAAEQSDDYVDNLGSNLTWNWNDFYKYLSIQGLTNTQSFTDEIKSNPNKLYLFSFYNTYANLFSKTCN